MIIENNEKCICKKCNQLFFLPGSLVEGISKSDCECPYCSCKGQIILSKNLEDEYNGRSKEGNN